MSDYLLGSCIVGAVSAPAAADLAPFFLTELPPDGEGMAQLYAGYMGMLDSLISSIYSVWHPVKSNATMVALYAVRKSIEDSWKRGTPYDRVVAVQMLAGVVGYFNARYRNADGSVNWEALDTPVNAAIIEGTREAAIAVLDTTKAGGVWVKDLAKGAKDAAETAWWTFVIGGAVVVGGVGFLLWKAMDSGTARAAVQTAVPYPFRRY